MRVQVAIFTGSFCKFDQTWESCTACAVSQRGNNLSDLPTSTSTKWRDRISAVLRAHSHIRTPCFPQPRHHVVSRTLCRFSSKTGLSLRHRDYLQWNILQVRRIFACSLIAWCSDTLHRLSILDPGQIPQTKGVTRYTKKRKIHASKGSRLANFTQGFRLMSKSVVPRRSQQSSITTPPARFVPSARRRLAKEYMKRQKRGTGSRLNGLYSNHLVVRRASNIVLGSNSIFVPNSAMTSGKKFRLFRWTNLLWMCSPISCDIYLSAPRHTSRMFTQMGKTCGNRSRRMFSSFFLILMAGKVRNKVRCVEQLWMRVLYLTHLLAILAYLL